MLSRCLSRLLSGFGCLLAVVVCAAVHGDPAALIDAPAALIDAGTQRLRAQEPAAALSLAERAIDEAQAPGASAELSAAYALAGEASAALGQFDDAREQFERARLALRVIEGLDTSAQIPIYHREAEILLAARMFTEANDREERAFEIARRHRPRGTEAWASASLRLADFYLASLHIPWARALYDDVAQELEESPGADTAVLRYRIKALQNFALTYRMERFRPLRTPRYDSIKPRPFGVVPPVRFVGATARRPVFGRYGAAAKAFEEAISLSRTLDDPSLEAEANLKLGDWHMLSRHSYEATRYYTRAWQVLAAHSPEATQVLTRPRLLRMPNVGDPETPRAQATGAILPGFIEFAFRVDAKGAIRRLEKVAAEPLSRPLYKYFSATRNAQFRPALRDGVPVATNGVSYTHRFSYYAGWANWTSRLR